MPNMHFCTGRVNLSGQGFHIINIEATDPVSWPEVQVLMQLHGDENVIDVKPVLVSDVSPVAEKIRLRAKYGRVVDNVFPGRVFHMEMLMPGHATDQQRADGDGVVTAQLPDDDEDEETGSREPPTGPPVFKPARHPRPLPPDMRPPAVEG